MPKTNSQRTFTACWTCRRRNVRCDNATPACGQCCRLRVPCEGYNIRLVWVDSETGSYAPQQRRSYACDTTWKGFPALTLQEVGHLIEECEQIHDDVSNSQDAGATCRCRWHRKWKRHPHSPFGMFRSVKPEVAQGDSDSQGSIDSSGSDTASDIIPHASSALRKGWLYPTSENFEHLKSLATQHEYLPAIILPPFQSPALSANRQENYLFSHYVRHVSSLMVPVSGGRNPWKSTYPFLAVHRGLSSSSSGRAVFHAILSQSAHHLANTKGPQRGAHEKSVALQYFGMALKDLQDSLASLDLDSGQSTETAATGSMPQSSRPPAEEDNFSSIMAALLSVLLAEHVYHGNTQGWRSHFRGARELAARFLEANTNKSRGGKPWMQSRDAWVIAQSFALISVLARTTQLGVDSGWERRQNRRTADSAVVVVGNKGLVRVIDDKDEEDELSRVYSILSDATAQPRFGYTIGSSPRLIDAIHQTRVLEGKMSRGVNFDRSSPSSADNNMTTAAEQVQAQAQALLESLRDPKLMEQEVQVYVDHHQQQLLEFETSLADTSVASAPADLLRTRTVAYLHLRLFNVAVQIHINRTIMRLLPSALLEDVSLVFSDTIVLLEEHHCNASTWPVFVAAVEAYKVSDQDAARRYFAFSEEIFGAANRADAYRVVKRVWAKRERIAAELCCELGDVIVDWREVVRETGLDFMLL